LTNEAAQRVAAAQATQPDLLTLDDIGVRLGGRQVLSDVTFSLRKGEFTGIIGPNGAGKTTLLRVILGLLEPSGGKVLVNGEPVDSKSKSAIGYVPQKLVIDPDMPLRARDVVGLGLDGHRLGFAFPSRQRRDQIEAALSDVGASRYADARVGELSGDEPLANLDLRSEQEIVAVLGRLAREQQIAILLSAHDMNPLLGVMDRIVYVANGRVATGPTDEVVTSEGLTRLYGHRVDVVRVQNRVLVVAGE
jgi:zinc/manganese transport system ATP-binding protein